VVLVEEVAYPGAGDRGDVGPAVEHLGHYGQRDPSLGGDVGQGGPAPAVAVPLTGAHVFGNPPVQRISGG
jgi:hypothetical protein